MCSYTTEAERLVCDLDRNHKDEEHIKAVGEKLSNIAHNDEQQMVEFLKNEEAQTVLVKLLYDVSISHPDQAHIFWHIISQQYVVCRKRFKAGCMQVLKIFAKSGRLFETLPIFERAFQKNDVLLLKAMADVRTNLGKDPVWRVSYDEKAKYAQMEEGKVKMFVTYICSGTLNQEMLSMALNDLMIMMMGHDALKLCFWKEQGIEKFSKLMQKLHNSNDTDEFDLEHMTTCLRIIDSAMVIISENPSLSKCDDIKCMCMMLLEVLKSKKGSPEICASSVPLLVKVVTTTNLAKHLVDLGFRELVQDVQSTHVTHLELFQSCGMFLMTTSPSQLLHEDDDSSSSLASNANSTHNSGRNRSGRSKKTIKDKRTDRKTTVRERTVRPPPRRNSTCSSPRKGTEESVRSKNSTFQTTQETEK